MKMPMILEYVASLGHAVFTEGLYNLNLIGVRTVNGVADAFDDWMVVAYKDETGWVVRWFPITTEPGLYYMMNPDKQLNPAGTAILALGQYRSTWGIGPHGRTKYEALTQIHGTVKVHRDNDHDDEHDYNVDLDEGWFGINIHASSMSPYEGNTSQSKVGAWSGGCQVFQDEDDFRLFMALCKKQVSYHPTWTKFTYTLVPSKVAA